MYKKKPLFVTFEGVEGSGKSYQSKKLYKNLKTMGFRVILTREPGGTHSAEKIRNVILKDYFHKDIKEKFDKYSDTLLYLAARNEHIKNKIKPALNKKNIVICDRFVDSTLAYQVYGKGVDRRFVDTIHKYILNDVRPDLTFVLSVKINKALKRLKKRRVKNRYDKFSKSFYSNVQKAFIKIARRNKKKYIVLDNSKDSKITENTILKKCSKLIYNENSS
mgnify:CR=1 FL=1|tara:strand:- start:8287 stop:8946 length:660 start_codon:yes stop_codon:yes gene_type:complete